MESIHHTWKNVRTIQMILGGLGAISLKQHHNTMIMSSQTSENVA